MLKSALLLSAALALAPAAAHADLLYYFWPNPDLGISPRLRMNSDLPTVGHISASFTDGRVTPFVGDHWWDFESYASNRAGYGDPLGTGSIDLTINPDGTIQRGSLSNTYGGDVLTMASVQDDVWFGDINGQGFNGHWTVMEPPPGSPLDPPGVQSVPEPAALALLPVGLLGLAIARRRA